MEASKITEVKKPQVDMNLIQRTADSVEFLKREVQDLKSEWPYARKRLGTIAIAAMVIALFTFAIALLTIRGASPSVVALQGQVNQTLDAISLLQDHVGTLAGNVDASIAAIDAAELRQFNVLLDKIETGADHEVKAQVSALRQALGGLLILIAEKEAGPAVRTPAQEIQEPAF